MIHGKTDRHRGAFTGPAHDLDVAFVIADDVVRAVAIEVSRLRQRGFESYPGPLMYQCSNPSTWPRDARFAGGLYPSTHG